MILAILLTPSLRTNSNILVAFLASIDLLVGALCAPLTTAVIYYGRKSSCPMIAANNFLTTQFCAASVFLLCSISVDRYLHFVKLLDYQSFMTKAKLAAMVCISWVLASIFGLMFISSMSRFVYHIAVTVISQVPLVIITWCYKEIYVIVQRKTHGIEHYRKETSHQAKKTSARGKSVYRGQQRDLTRTPQAPSVMTKQLTSNWSKTEASAITAVSIFVKPPRQERKHTRSSNAEVSNVKLGRNQIKHPRNRRKQLERVVSLKEIGRQTSEPKQKWKLAKTIAIMIIAYTSSWTPYVIVSLIWASRVHKGAPRSTMSKVYQWTLFLGFINSAINPIIYCFRQRNIRRGIRRVLRKIECCFD